MDEKKKYKGFFGNIERVFDWITDIHMRITNYHNVCDSHKKEFDRAEEFRGQNQRLTDKADYLYERVCELVDKKEDLEEQVEFFVSEIEKSVEGNPKYQSLEKEVKEYSVLVKQRGKLIDHLKEDKKGLIKFSNQIIDKIPEALMDFLRENKHFQKQPYIFVNSRGKIVGHTSGFKEKLKISGKLIGENCYKCLVNRYSQLDGVTNLRSFFNTYEERDFDISIEDEGEKIKLHFIKEEPVLLKGLDLRVLGRSKSIDPIAFIPILVKPISKIGSIFHHDRSLDELIEKHKEQRKEIYHRLVTIHGWTEKRITERESEPGGYDGLREEYEHFEKELKQKQKKDSI